MKTVQVQSCVVAITNLDCNSLQNRKEKGVCVIVLSKPKMYLLSHPCLLIF